MACKVNIKDYLFKVINTDILNKKNLEFAIGYWDVLKNRFPDLTSQRDVLKNLFKMEKDLVFGMIAEMGIELTPNETAKIQRIPTKNIQAFLAYCTGLEMEDTGNYTAAVQYYQNAVTIDPGFEKAGQKVEESQALIAAGTAAGDIDVPITGQPLATTSTSVATSNLVNNRLHNLANSIGTMFVPGRDSRESPQEASRAGRVGCGALTLAPSPPIRR